MSEIAVTERGARMKMFIPCMGGRCAEHGGRMALIDYMDERTHPKYRCTRQGCYFYDNPYDAREIVRWHTDPDAPRRKAGERDKPTRKEWETAV